MQMRKYAVTALVEMELRVPGESPADAEARALEMCGVHHILKVEDIGDDTDSAASLGCPEEQLVLGEESRDD